MSDMYTFMFSDHVVPFHLWTMTSSWVLHVLFIYVILFACMQMFSKFWRTY